MKNTKVQRAETTPKNNLNQKIGPWRPIKKGGEGIIYKHMDAMGRPEDPWPWGPMGTQGTQPSHGV